MPWLSFAGTRLGSQGFYPHDTHKTTDPVSADWFFWSSQFISNTAATHPGMIQIQFVYAEHQFQIANT
jgi:hypothetical protein